MAAEKDFAGILIKRGRFWHYQVYVPGRGLWKRSTKKTNYQQAVVAARKLHAQAMLLKSLQDDSLSLASAITREIDRVDRSASTARANRVGECLQNFLCWAGEIEITKIDTDMLSRYQVHRATCRKKVNVGRGAKLKRVDAANGATVSTSTIRMEVSYVIRMLRENGFVVAKPPLPVERQSRPGRPFMRDELRRFFAACARYPKEDPGRYTALFMLLLCTGARPAEIIPSDTSRHIALLKREVDYAAGVVTIRSAKVHPGRRSKVSRVNVSHEVLALVAAAADKCPTEHVFAPMTLHCVFGKILKRAKIAQVDELGEKLTAHSFRHTFGTLLAEQGVNAFVIQNLMRHADMKMTSRYAERATAGASVIDVGELLTDLKKAAPVADTAEATIRPDDQAIGANTPQNNRGPEVGSMKEHFSNRVVMIETDVAGKPVAAAIGEQNHSDPFSPHIITRWFSTEGMEVEEILDLDICDTFTLPERKIVAEIETCQV